MGPGSRRGDDGRVADGLTATSGSASESIFQDDLVTGAARGERLLGALGRVMEGRQLPCPPPPSLRQLRVRRSRRKVPWAGDLFEGLPTLPFRGYRSQGDLQVSLTFRGLRASHPSAHFLAIFAITSCRVTLLAAQDSRTPGVSCELDVHFLEDTEVVAVAAATSLDTDAWAHWLGEHHTPGSPLDLLPVPASKVHIQQIHVPSRVRFHTLQVHREPLPSPHRETGLCLHLANNAARKGDAAEAASIFRQCLEQAFTSGDHGGEAQAAAGLAAALSEGGYHVDGGLVLSSVIKRLPLDPEWGAWTARRLLKLAMIRKDSYSAGRWLRQARHLEGPGYSCAPFHEVMLGLVSGAPRQVLALADTMPCGETSWSAMLELGSIMAMVGIGEPQEALRRLDALAPSSSWPLEVKLTHLRARAHVCEARGRRPPWEDLLQEIAGHMEERDGGWLSAEEALALEELILLATMTEELLPARTLFRLRFLPTGEALDERVPLLGLLTTWDGLLALSPEGGVPVRHLKGSTRQLLSAAEEARRDAFTGEREELMATLVRRLFPEGLAFSQRTCILGTCESLANLPWPIATPTALREPTAFRRQSTSEQHGAGPVVTLQRSARPTTRQDGEPGPLTWTGHQVTKEALQRKAPSAGLLYLSMPVSRELGMPCLHLADGPVGPMDLSRLELTSSPVVALVSKGSPDDRAACGVERSLADGFLRAGARAVVTLRWPTQGETMAPFFTRLMDRWPVADMPQAVASISSQLRDEGHPPDIWANPVVY